jgi:NAD(P)H-dependent FMN reductase
MSTAVKPKIGIVISSIRENRFADKPVRWFLDIARQRNDLDFEIVDLRDYDLPMFAEPASPAYGPPQNEVARRWGAKLAELDGIVFVVAEYNRSVTGALKNALDYAYNEFNRKPAAFIAYGGVGGARAVEQLRLMAIELQMASTRNAVHINMEPFLAVMKGEKTLADYDYLNKSAAVMLDELSWWAHALKTARTQPAKVAA